MNKICRICLEEGVLSSVFTKNYNISLCDMVEYCCNIKISQNDGLPEQLCSNCIYKLGVAYHFKQTCESADIRLRQYLGLRIPEKFTDAAVMTDPVITNQVVTVVKKCKCKAGEPRKSSTNYKKKPECEKRKPGPKPKPKRPHSCYECHKQFRCQAQLDMHVRTHTGDKPFSCMYCPRQFAQKHNLTIHMRVHTGEKPFQCDVCSKRFSAQGNLHAHLKIHTGQRDHVCSLCNKSFITSSELTRHMNKHRGVKDYKCDVCGAAYIHHRDLKLHKLKKHQILPQSSKTQNETFNNSSNIDIIGIDVGKDVPEVSTIPAKDTHSHHIVHLVSEKPMEPTNNIATVDHHPLMSYDHKEVKEMYHHHHQYNKVAEQSCTICGEGFHYVTALAQHYMHQHKGYDDRTKSFGLNLT